MSLSNNKRNELINNGKIKLKIIKDDIISLNKNESLLKIIQNLEDEEAAEKNIVMQEYSKNRIIRFFYGKQFYSLFQFIKAKDYDEIINNIIFLLYKHLAFIYLINRCCKNFKKKSHNSGSKIF